MRMTRDDIKKIIPHREPMLLIDAVTDHREGERIETTFFVRPEWDIFQGHFPGDPVLPGVLAVECMAQASDILLLAQERFAGKTPYFIGIDQVRFKAKIRPGDTIVIRSKIAEERVEKAIVTCEAEIVKGDILAVSGAVTLAMR